VSGGFVLVVGPSGAGKDTLLDLAKSALAGDDRFVFPRRLVTRPVSAFEDHDTIGEAVFEAGLRAGAFALAWRAHGLGYAVPGETLALARAGRTIVVNVSRKEVAGARERLPRVAVVEITASPEILAQRLAARARPDDGDLEKRLARSRDIPRIGADCVIRNETTPQAAARELAAFLVAHASHA
jgi:ribose 1,5-bisphosphokinase